MAPDAHDYLDDNLELYALDALPEAESSEFESRLGGLERSSQEEYRHRLARTREILARWVSDTQAIPPPELRQRLLAAISPRPDISMPDAHGPAVHLAAAPSHLRRTRVIAAALAAAVVLLIGGGVIGRVTAPRPATVIGQPSVDQQVATVMSAMLAAPDSRINRVVVGGTPAGVTVASSQSLNKAFVIITAAPQPPTGRAYQLWAMGPGLRPRSAGTMTHMDPTETATVDQIHGYDQLAITVEPAHGSPAPTTTPVVALTL